MAIEKKSDECYALTGYSYHAYIAMFKQYFNTISNANALSQLEKADIKLDQSGFTIIWSPSLPEADDGQMTHLLNVALHVGEKYGTPTDEARFSFHHATTGETNLLERTIQYLETLIPRE